MMTQAWRERKSPLYAQRIDETIAWLMREMVVEGGGFASSLDADSEGEEGKFYVWSLAEIGDVLGETDAGVFAEIYGVTAQGNFEGHNILNRLGLASSCATPRPRRVLPRCGRSCSSGARCACAPASTTRCSPIGTG